MARNVILRSKKFLLFQLLDCPVNNGTILCMNHGDDLLLSSFEQHIQNLRIFELQGLISHVDFERRNSCFSESAKLRNSLRSSIGTDEMERVIAVAVASS